MKKKSNSVTFTLWCNRLVMLAVAVLVPSMPVLLRWYNTVRILSQDQNLALLAAFALWTMAL